MSKESIVFLLGLIIFLTQFLGIPEAWKFYLTVAAALVLIVCGYLLRRAAYRRKIDRGNGESGTDSFHESLGQKATEMSVEPDAAESTLSPIANDEVR